MFDMTKDRIDAPDVKTSVIFWLAVALSVAQLTVPIFFHLLDLQLRAIHVGLGISLAALVFPFKKKYETNRLTPLDILELLFIIAANVNIYIKTLNIYMYPGSADMLDLLLGIGLTVIILDTTRRAVGWAIPIIVAGLIFYALFGDIFPGMWKLRGLSWDFVVNSIYFSPLGIYGSVTAMSATFISLFIIFGALLSAGGGGKTFIDIAFALTGKWKGGPAKAAIVASALFGSISGSGVANVAVTGSYTIPMMKRLGYPPNFAGAVEAVASTGGGITPPIMSIAAFMMSEFLGISYLKIIGYAIIPCVLYYTSVYAGVQFMTLRLGLAPVPEDEIPEWKEILTFRRLSCLVIPIVILLGLIAVGRPLLTAGFYTCLSTIILMFISEIPESGLMKSIKKMIAALAEGGISLARIVPILVSVSILVNMVGITGIAPKISSLIMSVGRDSFIFALIISTIVPFLLGTSLPVVPTYVLSLSILAPSLLRLGADAVALHLFFIYWSLLGGLTPPTCTQAIVAAGIAKGDWFKTGINSVKLSIVAFIMPFFFVWNPAFVGRGTPMQILICAVTGFLGAIFMAYGFFGHIDSRANLLFRAFFFAGGVLLLFPHHLYSMIGLALAVGFLIIEKMVSKKIDLEGSSV
ncbi:MAG TPA: TRAP transporter fused permease subunit [Acetomicrobium hydrogeniformans]|uniref:TRAP transporter fused permease subunit n=2 Tax=Acetomicrobium hydrogeniformans TaxID=649746 RepID=A0A7V6ZDB4_9BACT|nr:TRAP transporter fused permease subunit [Acetomicrobium hydrogeniformans]